MTVHGLRTDRISGVYLDNEVLWMTWHCLSIAAERGSVDVKVMVSKHSAAGRMVWLRHGAGPKRHRESAEHFRQRTSIEY